MRDQLEQRLKQLKAEYESGQKMLADLEAKEANLRQTMLRISGAIQVLEEELAKADQPSPASEPPNGRIAGRPEPPASGARPQQNLNQFEALTPAVSACRR